MRQAAVSAVLITLGMNGLAIADRPMWTGGDDGNWRIGTTGPNKNWKLETAGTPIDFAAGDDVLFNDTATGTTTININSAHVSPTGITFDNTTKNYSIITTGSFGIAGATAMTKSGTGSLTISTNNSYSGGTTINGGSLFAGHSSAFGTGTLGLNGALLATTSTVNIANNIALTGSNTLGYAGQTGTITLSGAISGNGTLSNFVGMAGNSNVFFTGDFSGFTGTLNYTCDTLTATQWWRFGASNATVNLSNASVIINKGNVTDLSTSFSKNFGLPDGITGATIKIGALSGDGVFQSSFNDSGPNTLEVGNLNTSTAFSGVISGGNAGSNLNLVKTGTGTLTLSNENLYTGTTTINGGAISIQADNNIGAAGSSMTINGGTLRTTAGIVNSHPVTIGAAGATINVTTTGQFFFPTTNQLTGSGPLAITGAGTLAANFSNVRLGQTNTYSGAVTIKNGGILEYGKTGAVDSASTFTLENQAELAVQGSGTTTLPNAITVTGNTNSVISFENGTQGFVSGNILLNAGSNLTVGLRDWYDHAVARSGVINGLISGAGALTVDSGTGSGGVLTLPTTNTFTGNVVVNSSTLIAADASNTFLRTSGPLGDPSIAGRTVTINNGMVILALGNVLGTGGSSIAQAPALEFIVNPGGVLQTAANDAGGPGGGDANILGKITLHGGTLRTGKGYDTDYQAAILLGTVTVGGSTASSITTDASNTVANGVMLGDASAGSKTITFDVADATADAGADLTVSVRLTNSAGSTSSPANVGALTKTGNGKMVLAAANLYTGATSVTGGQLSITGSHNQNSPYSVTGTAVLDIGATGTLGASTLNSTTVINNAGTLSTSAGGNVAGITGAGATNVTGGTLNSSLGITQNALSLSNTSTTAIALNGGATGVSVVKSLAIDSASKLELHDNDLVVDYTGGSTVYTSILDKVKLGLPLLGFGGTGKGITSAEVIAQGAGGVGLNGTMLAVIDGSTTGGQVTSLSGFTVANPTSSVLVKYTWRGDANLDGVVNGSDYALADTGFSGGGTGWFYGDVNYDGSINGSDYALIDTGFSSQTGPLPEPAMLSLLGLGLVLMKRRRRFL
ncbi:MAG: autotransporter-associated beta strand repeat-containing protein [Burkholderiales bacterium]|nr:autotransporter-associated beta strand repeat-containing protein [Phycisphaerae bacterium]